MAQTIGHQCPICYNLWKNMRKVIGILRPNTSSGSRPAGVPKGNHGGVILLSLHDEQ